MFCVPYSVFCVHTCAMAPVSTRMTAVVQQHTTSTIKAGAGGHQVRCNGRQARWTSKQANSVRGPQRIQAFRKNNPANVNAVSDAPAVGLNIADNVTELIGKCIACMQCMKKKE